MRISDWSSDVCSSDLWQSRRAKWTDCGCGCGTSRGAPVGAVCRHVSPTTNAGPLSRHPVAHDGPDAGAQEKLSVGARRQCRQPGVEWTASGEMRSEEHTSELQSLMRSSYAVFCLK